MDNNDIDYGPLQLHIDKIQIEVTNQEEQDEVARWFEWAGKTRRLYDRFMRGHNFVRITHPIHSPDTFLNAVSVTSKEIVPFSKWKQRVSEDWRQWIGGNGVMFRTGDWAKGDKTDNGYFIIDKSSWHEASFTTQNLFLMSKSSRKIVKYVFKPGMGKYTKAVVRLEGNNKIGTIIETDGIDADEKAAVIYLLKEYGVLDEWFEPVYEPDKPLFKEITVSGRVFRIEKGKITTATCGAQPLEANLATWRDLVIGLSLNIMQGFLNTPEDIVLDFGGVKYSTKEMAKVLQEYDNFQKQFNETPNNTTDNGAATLSVRTGLISKED